MRASCLFSCLEKSAITFGEGCICVYVCREFVFASIHLSLPISPFPPWSLSLTLSLFLYVHLYLRIQRCVSLTRVASCKWVRLRGLLQGQYQTWPPGWQRSSAVGPAGCQGRLVCADCIGKRCTSPGKEMEIKIISFCACWNKPRQYFPNYIRERIYIIFTTYFFTRVFFIAHSWKQHSTVLGYTCFQ